MLNTYCGKYMKRCVKILIYFFTTCLFCYIFAVQCYPIVRPDIDLEKNKQTKEYRVDQDKVVSIIHGVRRQVLLRLAFLVLSRQALNSKTKYKMLVRLMIYPFFIVFPQIQSFLVKKFYCDNRTFLHYMICTKNSVVFLCIMCFFILRMISFLFSSLLCFPALRLSVYLSLFWFYFFSIFRTKSSSLVATFFQIFFRASKKVIFSCLSENPRKKIIRIGGQKNMNQDIRT